MDKDKPPFQMIIDFYFECGGTYEKLVDEFKVSIATIERWKDGMSVPPEEVRNNIMKRILSFNLGEIVESKNIIN